jgi:hypothetical protein
LPANFFGEIKGGWRGKIWWQKSQVNRKRKLQVKILAAVVAGKVLIKSLRIKVVAVVEGAFL